MRRTFLSFNRKLVNLSGLANEILAEGGAIPPNKRSALSEYVISETWQAWNTFSKDIIIMSVQGCKARDGLTIRGRGSSNNDYWRLCYEASCYAKRKPVNANGHTSFKYFHGHTWGDSGKIINVVNGFSPSNTNRLLNGFGAATHISDIQAVRNACAHKGREILLDLKTSLINKYQIRTVSHPSDYAWVSTLIGNDVAYFVWVNEMKRTASYVTESS
ncbi:MULTISPECIES: hypothetical protein [Aeromonas]|uniref:hypothetical protein n=1 Tax=Aeromonas TaxID=642 RepID=UPI0020B3312B|nr:MULTISPECIES: hypothetical protein [Aeromonas]MCP3322976.1 hypothetical protein [Aeromonas hydrophila]WAF99202.1 hypothetical protein NRZ31_00105 [Aeromonas dhakensis]